MLSGLTMPGVLTGAGAKLVLRENPPVPMLRASTTGIPAAPALKLALAAGHKVVNSCYR